jgi:hypothetical protein
MSPGLRRVVLALPLAAALGALAAGVACSRGDASSPDSHATLAVSPASVDVALAATQAFVTAPAIAVTWEVTRTPLAAAPAFPVRFSASGRYLEDQAHQPWRIQADAGWLLACATPANVTSYLDDRKAKGFNALYLMGMVHPGAFSSYCGGRAPNDYNNDPPFTTANDFTTPGTAYWANMDSIIQKAWDRGIAVIFFYDYLGYPGTDQGWWSEVQSQSSSAMTTWGTFLGNRYKGFPNVIWAASGDYGNLSGALLTNVNAAITAIKAAGANQLWAAEFNEPNQIPTLDDSNVSSIVDAGGTRTMNSYYGYGDASKYDVYSTADRAARVSPARPSWMQESTYEGEDNVSQGLVDRVWSTRRARFWSVLAGSIAGDGFGSKGVWTLGGGNATAWMAAWQSPGSVQSGHAFSLFASLPWWDLLPSGTGTGFAGKTLVSSGNGSCSSGDLTCITSAVTADGNWLLAYYPGTDGGTATAAFSVDLGAMSGPSRARWWNPRTGAWTAIATGLAHTGTQAFKTPGSNGGGNDWLLVLDAGANPCGSISATGLYEAPADLPAAGSDCGVRATSVADPNVAGTAHVVIH